MPKRKILRLLAIGWLITCTGLLRCVDGTVEFASTRYAMTEGGGVVVITLRMDPTGVTVTGSMFTLRILDDVPSQTFTSGPTIPLRDQNIAKLNFNSPVDELWHVEVSTDLIN